ncbi:MAG: hypothetical protein EOM20_06250 [Spartobacteria bacterium]|nr:hypothetical protein [Spartobacteria bacterium]
MSRVPYPGNISKDIRPRTRGRALGFTFAVTGRILLVILLFVVALAVITTRMRLPEQPTVPEAVGLFAKILTTFSACALLFILVAYIFFAPYKLFDGLADLVGFIRKKVRKKS